MRLCGLALTVLIAAVPMAEGATFQWTDEQGVVGFTDDLNNVPARYRNRVRTREDITVRNPRIRQELREQEQRLRLQEQGAPGGRLPPETSPENASRTTPSREIRTTPPPEDTLPPGRTKSQRIRDNIEQRRLREQ